MAIKGCSGPHSGNWSTPIYQMRTRAARQSRRVHITGNDTQSCSSALQRGVLVARRLALEDHELDLEERRQALVHALAADTGLLEPAEAHAEVGPHRVVPDGARPEPPADLAGPVDVAGEHRRVEP